MNNRDQPPWLCPQAAYLHVPFCAHHCGYCDFAVATGQDPSLDPALMEACREVIEPQLDAFRGAGALGGELPVPAGATAQQRFLAMLGRAG